MIPNTSRLNELYKIFLNIKGDQMVLDISEFLAFWMQMIKQTPDDARKALDVLVELTMQSFTEIRHIPYVRGV